MIYEAFIFDTELDLRDPFFGITGQIVNLTIEIQLNSPSESPGRKEPYCGGKNGAERSSLLAVWAQLLYGSANCGPKT